MSDEYYERLVDEDALVAYLEDHLGEVEAYEIERHQEGHSNETLFVTWGDRELASAAAGRHRRERPRRPP